MSFAAARAARASDGRLTRTSDGRCGSRCGRGSTAPSRPGPGRPARRWTSANRRSRAGSLASDQPTSARHDRARARAAAGPSTPATTNGWSSIQTCTAAGHRLDPEVTGGVGAEHDDGIRRRGGVEEGPRPKTCIDSLEERRIRRPKADPAAREGGMKGDRRTVSPPISATPAATSTSGIRRIIATATGERVAGSPVTDLPASIVSRFVPQPVELVEQVGPGRARDPGHADDRGDADRDPERRRGSSGRGASGGRRNPSASASRRRRRLRCRSRRPSRGHAATRPSRIRMRRVAAAATGSLWVMTAIVVPARLSSLEQLEDLGAGDAVEAAGRLVGEHDGRSADDRPRDRDPLPLAARQLARAMAHPMAQSDPLERLDRPLPSLAAGDPAVQQSLRDVLPARSGRRGGRTAGRRTRSTSPGGPTGPRSGSAVTSSPWTMTRPVVGRSSVPMIPSSVDLPEPDGPTIPTSSPSWTSRETSDRATVGGAPGYSFATCSRRMTGVRSSRPLMPGPRPGRPARCRSPRSRPSSGRRCRESTRTKWVVPPPATSTPKLPSARTTSAATGTASTSGAVPVVTSASRSVPSRSARAAGSVAAGDDLHGWALLGAVPVSGGATATAATLTIVPGMAVPSVVREPDLVAGVDRWRKLRVDRELDDLVDRREVEHGRARAGPRHRSPTCAAGHTDGSRKHDRVAETKDPGRRDVADGLPALDRQCRRVIERSIGPQCRRRADAEGDQVRLELSDVRPPVAFAKGSISGNRPMQEARSGGHRARTGSRRAPLPSRAPAGW